VIYFPPFEALSPPIRLQVFCVLKMLAEVTFWSQAPTDLPRYLSPGFFSPPLAASAGFRFIDNELDEDAVST